MRTACALVVVLSLVSSACNRTPPATTTPAAAASGDAALKTALDRYVVEFLRRYPTVNTYLGGGGLDASLKDVDGMLRDYSIAAMEAEDRWLDDTVKAIGVIDANTLSPAPRIDRDVALAQIQFMLHQHQVRHYQQRALDTYVSEPFRALDWQLQGMTQTGTKTYGTGAEWTLVVERIRGIPKFLAAAQDQLRSGVGAGNTPDSRMLRRDGIETAEANAKYFAQTFPQIAADRVSGEQRGQILGEINDASKQAKLAYESFRAFIASTYFQSSTASAVKPQFQADRFAMGETEYDWALKNNLRLNKTAAQLYDEAWPIVQDTQKQMIDLARQIGTQRKWPLPSDGQAAVRAVFDQLSKDYPKSDAEMIDWYRDAAFRLVDYGRKTQLFDVPADYKLDVTETPPPLQASIDGAAYYPAPPFKNSGVGRFYVSPTHNNPAALMSNNRAALADLSAHEGFPGHDWHYKVHDAVPRPHRASQMADRLAPSKTHRRCGRTRWLRKAGASMRRRCLPSRNPVRQTASTRRKNASINSRASSIAICACESIPASTPGACRTTRRRRCSRRSSTFCPAPARAPQRRAPRSARAAHQRSARSSAIPSGRRRPSRIASAWIRSSSCGKRPASCWAAASRPRRSTLRS